MSSVAGRSSLERFRRERREKLKQDWYLWLGIAALSGVAIALMSQLGAVGLVLGAWILGFVSALTLFGWMIGFDVHSLTWLWGSWGEIDTAAELKKLGPEWHVVHDIENAYGNWDHVAIGPTGVFMIDTKRLRGRVTVKEDGLASGRTRYSGSSFRGSSVRLRDALQGHVQVPWIQAVVAIWGNFSETPREEGHVAYVGGPQLVEWLCSRPGRLSSERGELLAHAVRRL